MISYTEVLVLGELIDSADGSISAALLPALAAVYAAARSSMFVSCTFTSENLQSLAERGAVFAVYVAGTVAFGKKILFIVAYIV